MHFGPRVGSAEPWQNAETTVERGDMSRLRRWLIKQLIGDRMVIANTVRWKSGLLAPRAHRHGAFGFGNIFYELEPSSCFRFVGRTRIERWVVSAIGKRMRHKIVVKDGALEFWPDDKAVVEDCMFLGSRLSSSS